MEEVVESTLDDFKGGENVRKVGIFLEDHVRSRLPKLKCFSSISSGDETEREGGIVEEGVTEGGGEVGGASLERETSRIVEDVFGGVTEIPGMDSFLTGISLGSFELLESLSFLSENPIFGALINRSIFFTQSAFISSDLERRRQ